MAESRPYFLGFSALDFVVLGIKMGWCGSRRSVEIVINSLESASRPGGRPTDSLDFVASDPGPKSGKFVGFSFLFYDRYARKPQKRGDSTKLRILGTK